MRRDLPYAIIVPAVVVGFAVVLMIWAISGGSGARMAGQGLALTTTGAAPFRPSDSAVRSPASPGNDGTGGSAPAIKGPENKTR
jgi:hypothetical protein